MINFKKSILFAVVLGTLGIYLTSCNKSETLENPVITDAYHLNQIPLSDLIVNEEDRDDERVMNASTLIAKALKPIVQKPVYAEYILEKAQRTFYNSVLLSDIIADFPEVSDIITTQLRELSDNQKSTLLLEELINQLVYKNIRYNPVIHVPNIDFADYTKTPVLSPGVEVPDNEAENIDDHYFFWLFDENGREYEITIGEAQANTKGAAPAFVLSLLDASDTANLVAGGGEAPKANAPVSSRDNFGIATNEFRLGQRYENSGKSEFYYAGLTFQPFLGGIWQIGDGEMEITKVRKRDIGKELGHWEIWFGYNSGIDGAVFNTYERDWAYSAKKLGRMVAGGGQEQDFYGERRYTSDCYWKTDVNNNTNLNGHDLDVDFFVSNPQGYWADEYEGDQGDITFWRVQ